MPAEERSSIAARSLVAKVMTVVLVSRVVFRVAVARVAGSAAPKQQVSRRWSFALDVDRPSLSELVPPEPLVDVVCDLDARGRPCASMRLAMSQMS